MEFPSPDRLGDYLAATVPFLIHELAQRSGPTQQDYIRLFQFRDDFPAFGADNMMFPSTLTRKERAESRRLWSEMAFAVAVMAFQPGGIKWCGNHFAAGLPEYAGLFPKTEALLREFWASGGVNEITAAFVLAANSRTWAETEPCPPTPPTFYPPIETLGA